MQQGVQTDAACNIQQCCVRLHGALKLHGKESRNKVFDLAKLNPTRLLPFKEALARLCIRMSILSSSVAISNNETVAKNIYLARILKYSWRFI